MKRRMVALFLAPAISTIVLSTMSACENGPEEKHSMLENSGTSGGDPGSTAAASEEARSSVERALPDGRAQAPSGGTHDDLVGDFCIPQNVPDYGLVSAAEGGNVLMTVVELVVDARDASEVDLTLIARDLKVSYFYVDALLVSFVDRSRPGRPETGEAQIINTVSGALILGMSEGPPNKEGLTVISYGDPASIDQDEVFARTACS